MRAVTLPAITDDPERARADLAEHGLALLSVLTRDEAATVAEVCRAVAADDVASGRGYTYENDAANQRLWALLNRGSVFVELVQHPTVFPLIEHLLGRPVLLSNFSGNVTGPGAGYGPLHCDQFYVPPPWPDTPLAANAAWLVTDFTAANGATMVVPGSHRRPAPLPAVTPPDDAVPVEAPAGTVMVLDARTWHQTGANTTVDEHRIGLFAYYVKPWLRTQEVWPASLDAEVRAHATPLLRELVGEVQYATLGGVNGQPLDAPRF